ncbi:hypothetical protein QF028_004989 [Neobacillus sp. B4I6]|uniref:hypothetical protein n=1 Tax=Neobacillus sp. B4I6 TaxID=3373925 RepID=UPI003D206DA9
MVAGKISLEIGESTVRAYVQDLRNEYKIAKETSPREYEAIPDSPNFGASVWPVNPIALHSMLNAKIETNDSVVAPGAQILKS